MASVLFQDVVKRYKKVTALQSFNLKINKGEFLTLLGPSGCGKTTTLRLIAGFIRPSEGKIFLGSSDITNLAPQDRNVGMVFQDYALFPHMTVTENIAFGLVERGFNKSAIKQRVNELLDLIELPDIGDRFPAQVSGGQRQRIAVARAVAYAPKVLLMDEPLGALDLKLRETMQLELRRIQQELGITAVYVTHDQVEAMNMSDRIAVMNLGLLEQVGTATEIYNEPQTKFVAGFVGHANFLPCKIIGADDNEILVGGCGVQIRSRARGQFTAGNDATLMLRPEHLKLQRIKAETTGINQIHGVVENTTFTGNLVHTRVRADEGTRLVVECRPDELTANVGDSTYVSWKQKDSLLLQN